METPDVRTFRLPRRSRAWLASPLAGSLFGVLAGGLAMACSGSTLSTGATPEGGVPEGSSPVQDGTGGSASGGTTPQAGSPPGTGPDGGRDAEAPPPPRPERPAAPFAAEPSHFVYQVYVRAFFDGDPSGDGSGDLRGLASKLDYLAELGVDTLLLMPVFKSAGGFGYIPTDYFSLDTAYGTEADLERLFDEAHRRNMRVLLDAPINHLGEGSPWFEKARAKACEGGGGSNADPVCGYFYFTKNPAQTAPYQNWRKPWDWSRTSTADVFFRPATFDSAKDRDELYYAGFSKGMPELAYWDFGKGDWNKPVLDEMLRFVKVWTQAGADGLRIDAAKHFVEGSSANSSPKEPKNLELLQKFQAEARAYAPGASMVGEIWSGYDDIDLYLPRTLEAALDFPYFYAIREGIESGSDRPPLRNVLSHLEATQETIPLGTRVAFAGNHDVDRLRTYFKGNESRMKLAHFLALLAPGSSLLFYGEEVGFEGIVKRPGPPPADPSQESEEERKKRLEEYLRTDRAFPWTAASPSLGNPGSATPIVGVPDDWKEHNLEAAKADADSVYNYVKSLSRIRAKFPRTSATRLRVNKDLYGHIVAYTLVTPGAKAQCRTVAVNFQHAETYTVPIRHAAPECAGAPLTEAWAQGARRDKDGGASVSYALSPLGHVVLDGTVP